MEAWKRYNKLLKEEWGTSDDGRARFRIALTNNQYEWRKGMFDRYTEAGIYLGTDVGIKQMPKYHYLGYSEVPHWALEGLMFIQGGMEDLMESDKGTYEPIHVFPLIEEKCQLPPWRAIQLLMYVLHYGAKRTVTDYMDQDEEKRRKEIELFNTIIENQSPYLAGQLHNKSAIVVP